MKTDTETTRAEPEAENRPGYTMKAQIEQMDNGAILTIRRQRSGHSVGEIILKKVYIDFPSLSRDLALNMEFNFERTVKGTS